MRKTRHAPALPRSYVVECGWRAFDASQFENWPWGDGDREHAIRRRAQGLPPYKRHYADRERQYREDDLRAHEDYGTRTHQVSLPDNSCPIHGYAPAIECPTCWSIADRDDGECCV